MSSELELEVFRAGEYGAKGRWDEASLDEIAADYSAGLHEAPVTLDHAQSGPALGWVGGVRRSGDRLIARLKGMNEDLMALLRVGAFKKRSVEIYRSLPETGRPYLKAVSFLGAGAPAVKGLRDVLFSTEAGAVIFRDELGGHEAFDYSNASIIGSESESADAIENEIDSLGASDGGESSGRWTASERFSELKSELRRGGRWVPSWELQGIEEFFTALSSLDEIEIGQDRAVSPAEWFARFLGSLPAYLPMGEAAPAVTGSKRSQIPSGRNVSAPSIELHRRVVAMREGRPELSYAQALRECASTK